MQSSFTNADACSYHTLPLVNLQNLKIKPFKKIKASEYLSQIDPDIKAPWKFIYQFKLFYQTQKWDIRRHFSQFSSLAKQMKLPFHVNEQSENVLDQLFEFLENILQLSYVQVYPPQFLLEFLELTYFQYENTQKIKECFLRKKKGNKLDQSSCFDKICPCIQNWNRRYFYITSESIYYSKGPEIAHCKPRDFIYFDYNFSILNGYSQTGNQFGIKLITSTKYFQLQAEDLFGYCEFLYSLKVALQQSEYTKIHRFDSFSTIQQGSASWLIDAHDYYEELFHQLLKARETVLIMSNSLNPEIYLRRPISQNQQSKLDVMLKYIADKGVNVYIKLQNPQPSSLAKLSQNIKVNTNPYQERSFLWEHNERLVIIDNQLAFIGSADLDLVALDTQSHDLDSITTSQQSKNIYNDISQINPNSKQLVHDVQILIQGATVHDLTRHFVQCWNYSVQIQNSNGNYIETTRKFENGYFQNECNNHHFHAYLQKLELETSAKPHCEEQKNDISSQEPLFTQEDDYESERDSEKVHYQRNKSERQQLSQVYQSEQNLDLSSCKQYLEVASFLAKSQQGIKGSELQTSAILKSKRKDHQLTKNPMISIPKINMYPQLNATCSTQVTRSVGSWGIGCLNQELSVQLSYLQLILHSKHFIYIENPTFISSCGGYSIENQIGKALIKRILQAHENQQKFKVVMLVNQSDEIECYFTLETLFKDSNSLFRQLKKIIEDPFEYLSIFSLKKQKIQIDGGQSFHPIQINSRLMIVDDEITVIGSAQINDRSMMGDRNTEICVVVEDEEKVRGLVLSFRRSRR